MSEAAHDVTNADKLITACCVLLSDSDVAPFSSRSEQQAFSLANQKRELKLRNNIPGLFSPKIPHAHNHSCHECSCNLKSILKQKFAVERNVKQLDIVLLLTSDT